MDARCLGSRVPLFIQTLRRERTSSNSAQDRTLFGINPPRIESIAYNTMGAKGAQAKYTSDRKDEDSDSAYSVGVSKRTLNKSPTKICETESHERKEGKGPLPRGGNTDMSGEREDRIVPQVSAVADKAESYQQPQGEKRGD